MSVVLFPRFRVLVGLLELLVSCVWRMRTPHLMALQGQYGKIPSLRHAYNRYVLCVKTLLCACSKHLLLYS